MSITRNEPWSILNFIQNEMNRAWEEQHTGKQSDNSNIVTSQWTPAVDIKENPNDFIIYADIPGVEPDKIEISMENNVLTIKGERISEKKEEHDNFSRVERIKGVFYRRFSLPDTADEGKISAHANHGVLEITIPKKEKAKPRKVAITVQPRGQKTLQVNEAEKVTKK